MAVIVIIAGIKKSIFICLIIFKHEKMKNIYNCIGTRNFRPIDFENELF